MKLSPLSVKELVKLINDDACDFIEKSRSGPDLVDLFNSIGGRDEYWSMADSGTFGSRKDYTKRKLNEFNQNPLLKKLFEQIVDDRMTDKNDLLASKLNDILKHDGYKLQKNSDDIYNPNRG